MSRLLPTEPIPVSIGACQCPDTPHDEDVALLRPRLLPGDAMAALSALDPSNDEAAIQRDVGMAFLHGGVVSWNILDDAGQPVPLSAMDTGALDWDETLRPIADKAAELYTESLFRPLLHAAKKSSQHGRTDG